MVEVGATGLGPDGLSVVAVVQPRAPGAARTSGSAKRPAAGWQRPCPDVASTRADCRRAVGSGTTRMVATPRQWHWPNMVPARRGRVVDELEEVLVVPRDHAEGDRYPRVEGQATQPIQELGSGLGVTGPGRRFQGQLEDAGPLTTEHGDEAPHLVPAGQPASHRPVVRGLVVRLREVVNPMAPARMADPSSRLHRARGRPRSPPPRRPARPWPRCAGPNGRHRRRS